MPFDPRFRRSVRGFPGRDFELKGIGPSRLGRMATGDPGFVRECIVLGADVRIDTADAVRLLVGEAPLRPRFCREPELFMELTGTKPWVIGWRLVQRLQSGASPYLTTVDGVRDWMYGQLGGRQRRAVFAAVPGTLPFRSAPSASPRVKTFHSQQGPARRTAMSEQCVLLTTRQAAERLGLSPRTLERYRVTGDGPEFVKMGHAVRYMAGKLNEWLEGRTRRSTSDDGDESGEEDDE